MYSVQTLQRRGESKCCAHIFVFVTKALLFPQESAPRASEKPEPMHNDSLIAVTWTVNKDLKDYCKADTVLKLP